MLVLINLCAYVGMLFLESPMLGLEKALLHRERRTNTEKTNGLEAGNGQSEKTSLLEAGKGLYQKI